MVSIPIAWGQDSEKSSSSEDLKSTAFHNEATWVNDAIEMLKFIEDNELILRENSYVEYEQLVLNAPSEEKLNRLYELLIDAMFVGSADVTAKYMPIYVAEIESSGSTEHEHALKVLTVATEGYTNWTYEEAIKALEMIAFDETTHTGARLRALSITGFLYGYAGNTDHIVTTLQKMEALSKTVPENIFIEKETTDLKSFLAVFTNDPEEMVKHSAEFLRLANQTKSLIYGEITSGNFTHLVMEYGDVESIDRIDAINQRIAHMTEKNSTIARAYINCGEYAVKLDRLAKALDCFDNAERYLDHESQFHIRYYLYSAIAYARDGQVEKARRNLETVINIPDVESNTYFKEGVDWAKSEVLQTEGQYDEAYKGLRTYFTDRLLSQKKELGEVTKSMREYSEDKAALLKEKTEVLASKERLQDGVIFRQRILIFLSAILAIILLGFVQVQRLNTIKLRKAREKTIEANQVIFSEARTDQLTRIGNRRAFYEYCSVISDDTATQNYTLAILDLDGFKLINDTLGHEIGDIIIQETSSRLNCALEGKGQVFRLGGDEFAIIFLAQDDGALNMFRSCVSEALKMPVKTDRNTIQLKWSVGAVSIEGENQDPRGFLGQADYALYQAKALRGPSFHIFSDDDLENINKEARLADEVLWNLTRASFTMFGQIIVSSKKGKNAPFGVEALVRAQTRSGDPIPPESFISHAVSAGKISLFTKLSLLKSIEMLKESGLDCPLLFNLSREQIIDPNVLDIVSSVLELSGFPPNRLIVELSERTLNQDLSSASETLQEFRQQGIRIALDDFGSANTGFSSLLEFEFDLIKTDRNLLCSAMEFPRTKHLLSNLVDLSQKLNVLCIIEGIETPAEVSFVKGLGGEILQGYIFGRPEETPKYRPNLPWVQAVEAGKTVLDLERQKKLA